MGSLKFYKFNMEKVSDDEVKISFDIKFLKGVDKIVAAFQAGKDMLEGKLFDGVMGLIQLATTMYSFIKIGKK